MSPEPHIEVFIPAYNAELYIERCLESVAIQSYRNFHMVMVDDASTDETGKIMEHSVSWFPPKATFIRNSVNQKMPHNMIYLREGDPNDVIFLLDGDDFLPHEHVFSTIAHYYEHEDLWLTYGSYTRYPDPNWMPNPALPFPDSVVETLTFREAGLISMLYNHPLTFRRWLFNELNDADLQDDEGNWFLYSYDHTIMMPMLEMAAHNFKWLPDTLYVYNEENPTSEIRVSVVEGDKVHKIVNARPKRSPLA